MRGNGSCRYSWGSWWALLAAGCVLALLLCARPASAQSESSDKLTSIEASLIDSLEASSMLRQVLSEQMTSRLDLETAYVELKQQLQLSRETLQKRIDELTQQLNDSLTLSDTLRAEISRLTKLLAASNEESAVLSKAFDDYRAEVRGQISGLERRVTGWKIGAIVVGIWALLATIFAVVK